MQIYVGAGHGFAVRGNLGDEGDRRRGWRRGSSVSGGCRGGLRLLLLLLRREGREGGRGE